MSIANFFQEYLYKRVACVLLLAVQAQVFLFHPIKDLFVIIIIFRVFKDFDNVGKIENPFIISLSRLLSELRGFNVFFNTVHFTLAYLLPELAYVSILNEYLLHI